MAVKQKGEIAFEVQDGEDGDKTKTYTLKLSFTALCKIEEITGQPSTETLKKIVGDGFEFTAVRLSLFAALQEKHAKEFQRPEDVDDLIERTSLEDVRSALSECIGATWQRLAPKQWEAQQKLANPQTASGSN